MKAVFHHIYFLPWLGYFSKLEHADCFVILDNVGFRRNHIKRVKILNPQGEEYWLCIPVGNNWGKNCSSIKMPQEKKYILKFFRTIQMSYGRSEFYNENIDFLKETLNTAFNKEFLTECNIEILVRFREYLNLKKIEILKASAFGEFTDKTQRIIKISNEIGINALIMGNGNMQNIHNLKNITESGIELFKQDVLSHTQQYPQGHRKKQNLGFVSGLSIIDVLFNCGKSKTTEMIKNPIFLPKIFKDETQRN